MPGALFALCGVFVIICTDELLWRLKLLRGEKSRGLVHLLVGSFISVWPFFMSMRYIQAISLLMLAVIAVSRRYHIFQGIHAVQRRTYGEYFYPVSVGLCALITSSDLIFMAAILHLSVADGLASLIGAKFGRKTQYKIFGQTKSWLGTATFYIVSLVILAFVGIGHIELFLYGNVWLLATLPIIATAAESVAVFGLDDLVVPILVVSLLQYLHVAV